MEKRDMVERGEYVVCIKDDVTYLPHYRNFNVYVGPGYGNGNYDLYTLNELVDAGAKVEMRFLWTRGSHGEVNERRP
jgi:hypothetical protein